MALYNYYSFLVHKIPVAVLGGTGYAGATLCELIGRHPAFELAFATARTRSTARRSCGGCCVSAGGT